MRYQFRYMLSYPLSLDQGGGSKYAMGVIESLKGLGYFVEPIDWDSTKIDFNALLVFGFTFINFEALEGFKKRGIRILIFPVFDRLRPAIFNRLSLMIGDYLGVGTLDKVRRRNLNASDGVYVLNSTEKTELSSIFKVDSNRIHVIHLAIPEEHFRLYDSIDAGLFYDTYRIKDFVFYPSAKVSKRKRQVQLLKALRNSTHSIVLTGCDEIEGSIEAEFNELVRSNHNVLALPKVSKELLISCYKNARVCVSLSSAETAGIANLEAAYAGCNLVVSDIPPFREYLRQFATYINPLSLRDIQDQITLAMSVKHDSNVIDFIRSNFTWSAYGRKFLKSLD